jgi:hypothetical protein
MPPGGAKMNKERLKETISKFITGRRKKKGVD